jgi:hypothetical protein
MEKGEKRRFLKVHWYKILFGAMKSNGCLRARRLPNKSVSRHGRYLRSLRKGMKTIEFVPGLRH